MCKGCNGSGKLTTEVIQGVWALNPCSCIEPVERDWKAYFERWEQKIEERRAERELGYSSAGGCLLTS